MAQPYEIEAFHFLAGVYPVVWDSWKWCQTRLKLLGSREIEDLDGEELVKRMHTNR